MNKSGRSLVCLITFVAIALMACNVEKKSDRAGEEMQNFVINISNYARGLDPEFIVIPQNGPELAFNFLTPGDGLNPGYLSAVDGFGIEELFYNGGYAPDQERLSFLRQLPASKKVMVAEYVSDDANVPDAIQKNLDEGFICFPRVKNNYDYLYIPDSVSRENADDVVLLQDAKNYLYLISTDNFSDKQKMLDAIAASNFDLVLIDLFFEEAALTAADIQSLKTKANGAKRLVIAYMNIGSAENYRYYWQGDWKLHKPNWLKKPYEGFEDEIWVKFWHKDWQQIIYGNDASYTKKILDAGFDGVYLDNVEGYYFLYFD